MSIPDKDAILGACRMAGHWGNPVLGAAARLAALHEAWGCAKTSLIAARVSRRVALIRVIDIWVSEAVPLSSVVCPVHAETVGQVVDRVARLTIQTYRALAQPSRTKFEEAWVRLDQSGDDYQDLIDALVAGTRRLPEPLSHRIEFEPRPPGGAAS